MTIAIDTHRAVEALRHVGFKKEQAQTLIEQLVPTNNELVTKDFLAAETNKLRAEISNMKAQLIMWMIGLHMASLSLMYALFES